MNSGTQAAKGAGNKIDLDSDPTKRLEVVETALQVLDGTMVEAAERGAKVVLSLRSPG